VARAMDGRGADEHEENGCAHLKRTIKKASNPCEPRPYL
jgi:hypothetical protein